MAILTVPREEELHALARSHDLGELTGFEGLEAGTVNTSYRLETPTARWFLRLYEEQGVDGADAEAELLLHLARSGVPTPAPRETEGRAVQLVAGKPAVVFPWVEGDMLCQAGVTPEAARLLGEALARVHLAGPAPGQELGGGRFGPEALLARCPRVATSTDPEARVLASSLEEAVRAAASRRRKDLPSGLVHGDLFRDNVLWREGKIAALLDFESAHRGPFAFDLAVTILAWSFRDELDTAVARAVLDGYGGVRPLIAAEREALHAEAVFASLRFTITRITDEAIRVGKRWQRFVARREVLEGWGEAGFRERLGL